MCCAATSCRHNQAVGCNICSALKTLCGKIGCSTSRNPARTCTHATSFNQLLEHHFKLRLVVDTGGAHPNMIRENFTENLHRGSKSIEPDSLHSAGMQESSSSQSTTRLSSHWPVQAASVCHKHVPLSQLREGLSSFVSAFDCIAPSPKNGQTVCAVFRHPSLLPKHQHYFIDQCMWFVLGLGGISTSPPCVENVVSFEEKSNSWGENRGSGICYKRKCRMWIHSQNQVEEVGGHPTNWTQASSERV